MFLRVQVFQGPGFPRSRFFWFQAFFGLGFSVSRFFRVQLFLGPGFSEPTFFRVRVRSGPLFWMFHIRVLNNEKKKRSIRITYLHYRSAIKEILTEYHFFSNNSQNPPRAVRYGAETILSSRGMF